MSDSLGGNPEDISNESGGGAAVAEDDEEDVRGFVPAEAAMTDLRLRLRKEVMLPVVDDGGGERLLSGKLDLYRTLLPHHKTQVILLDWPKPKRIGLG